MFEEISKKELIELMEKDARIPLLFKHMVKCWGEEWLPSLFNFLSHTVEEIKFLYARSYNAENENIAAILNKIRQLPIPHNKNYQSFSVVNEQVYQQPGYPLLEHSFYLSIAIIRLKLILELADRIQKEKVRFCDLGVGPGVVFSHLLLSYSEWKGVAVDVSGFCLKHTRNLLQFRNIPESRYQLHLCDIQKDTPKSAPFDLVVATEVLEHLENPKVVLSQIKSFLKPNGYCLTSIPLHSPWGPHLVVFNDEKQIRSMYEDVGFSILAFESFSPIMTEEVLTFALLRNPI